VGIRSLANPSALSPIALGLALALQLALAPGPAAAADATRPHPHQGILAKIEGSPPRPTLDAKQQAKVARGEGVLVRDAETGGGRGYAVQAIHATPETIWGRIRDFAAYPRMVSGVKECEIYYEEGDDVRVRFIITAIGFEYEYFIRHQFNDQLSPQFNQQFKNNESYATWTLDYTRESDLGDSVGSWRVDPHPDGPEWSLFYYSVDMRTRGWMPGFVRRIIEKKGLRDATEWVKRESEAAQRALDAAGPVSR